MIENRKSSASSIGKYVAIFLDNLDFDETETDNKGNLVWVSVADKKMIKAYEERLEDIARSAEDSLEKTKDAYPKFQKKKLSQDIEKACSKASRQIQLLLSEIMSENREQIEGGIK